jgi:hypothetical protein
MPILKGIECWLEDADDCQRFDEYETKYYRGWSVTSYVASEQGKSFSINFRIDDPLLASCCFVTIFEDQSISHPALDAGVQHTRIMGIQKSEITFLPFVFDINKVTGVYMVCFI